MDDLIGPLLERLPPSPVIVEAGAHTGIDTLALAAGAAHVYAFEPAPGPYARLEEVARTAANVTAYPTALGRRTRVRRMWISTGGLNGDGSSSLFEPTRHREMFPGIPFADEPIEVVVASLAGWAVDSGCYRIDGLWLDMQGGELDALKGAGPLLDGVTALVLEYSIVGLYDGAPLWLEVRGWLEAKGFEVVRETIDAGAPQGNALVAR